MRLSTGFKKWESKIFIRPDFVPIGGPEEHARCFLAVISAKVSKDFQIC